jgi:hypothetical protein
MCQMHTLFHKQKEKELIKENTEISLTILNINVSLRNCRTLNLKLLGVWTLSIVRDSKNYVENGR